MNNKFIKEKEIKICQEYFSKEKPNTMILSKKWGCSQTTVCDIICRNGYILRTYSEANKIFTKEEELQICNEYFNKNKLTGKILAEKWNCTSPTIINIIRRNGYKVRTIGESRKIFTKDQELQICNDYFSKEKPGLNTLSKKWGCGNFTIRNIIKRNGYKLRAKGEACIGKRLKPHSEETKQIIREKTILQLQNYKGPFKDTKPELKMKEILNELNIPFEHRFRVDKCLFDFRISNTNILIEVDGDYWHSNPKIYSKLNKKQLELKERDKKHDVTAKANNFTLIRFWESDILNSTEIVKNKLVEVVNRDK